MRLKCFEVALGTRHENIFILFSESKGYIPPIQKNFFFVDNSEEISYLSDDRSPTTFRRRVIFTATPHFYKMAGHFYHGVPSPTRLTALSASRYQNIEIPQSHESLRRKWSVALLDGIYPGCAKILREFHTHLPFILLPNTYCRYIMCLPIYFWS